MKKFGLLLFLFLVWRLFLFVPLYVGHEHIVFDIANKDDQIWAYTRPYPPVDSFLLYPWANFDGVYYLTIAGNGYSQGAVGRFFPFYPFLISTVSHVFGGIVVYAATQFLSAFFIANLCFLGSVFIFYKLLRLDYPENISLWSIIFLLVFPASFFLGSIYPESTFLLLSLLSLYFARKKQILAASIFGLFLTLTRVVGIFIVFAILYEFFKEKKWKINKMSFIHLLPVIIIPLGLLGFMVFNYQKWHDFLYFIHAQQAVTNGRSHLVLFFPQTVFRYVKILISLNPHQFQWWISLLEIVSFFVAGFLLYIGWKKHIRISYMIFATCCFIAPSISGTFSGMPRYVLILFPIFISAAYIKNVWIKTIICVFCVVLLFLLTMFFSRGYLIA